MSYRFPASERLKSRKIIDGLFKDRKGFMAYPFKVVWCRPQEPSADAPMQMAVSVPKRTFKHATDRNLLKRRTKEAWRLNKQNLSIGSTEHYAVMFIYVAKEKLPLLDIEHGIKKAIRKLPEEWAREHQK